MQLITIWAIGVPITAMWLGWVERKNIATKYTLYLTLASMLLWPIYWVLLVLALCYVTGKEFKWPKRS